jgi:hypothetical protein
VNDPTTTFDDDELWILDDTGTYWVEQGMAYGDPADQSLPRNIAYWFWADDRPQYGYFEHDRRDLSVNNDQDYTANITFVVTTVWNVSRDGVSLGQSTNNFSGPAYELRAGSESNAYQQHVDVRVKFLKWLNTSNSWQNDWIDGTNQSSLQAQDGYTTAWVNMWQGAHITSYTGGC